MDFSLSIVLPKRFQDNDFMKSGKEGVKKEGKLKPRTDSRRMGSQKDSRRIANGWQTDGNEVTKA